MLDEEVKRRAFFVGDSFNLLSAIVDGLKLGVRDTLRGIISEHDINLVYMHNIQPFLNEYLAKIARTRKAMFVQHIHEPFVEDKSVYGGTQQFWLYLFEYAQERILTSTDIAVVSSREGMRLFEKRYPFYEGKKKLIPLMYEDLGQPGSFAPGRRFVTFVGPLSRAKGSNVFIQTVAYASAHAPDLEFQVISRKETKELQLLRLRLPNLHLYCKERISDVEFGTQLRRSAVVLAPYASARQSSTVLTSFMYGVPVIATAVGGLNEVIRDGETGYLVNPGATPEEWINAIRDVKDALPRMSVACRSVFEREFSESNWRNYLEGLLSGEGMENDT